MPWFKGLLTPTNFKKYAIEEAKNTIVTDIYGKEWNIVKDKIQIIFMSRFNKYEICVLPTNVNYIYNVLRFFKYAPA